MNEKRQLVKRFLHDNAVTLGTILLFIIILGILIGSRYGSLYSIRNIANINPLITNDSAELVAVNVNGVIKILKDEDGSPIIGPDGKSDETNKNSSPNKSTGGNSNSGGSSSGGGSGSSGSSGGGSSSGGGGSSPSPSPSSSPSSSPSPSPSSSPSPPPPPPPTPLAASVSALSRTNRRIYDKGGLIFTACKNDHTIQARVEASAGSGAAKLQWRFNNSTIRTDDLGFLSSGDKKTSDILITTNAVGTYSVTVNILNASNTVIGTRTYNFSHSC